MGVSDELELLQVASPRALRRSVFPFTCRRWHAGVPASAGSTFEFVRIRWQHYPVATLFELGADAGAPPSAGGGASSGLLDCRAVVSVGRWFI